MKNLTVFFLVIFLAGCAGRKALVVETAPVQPPQRTPPAEALVVCERPGALEDKSFGGVVRKLSQALSLLTECESKRKQLAEFTTTK
jgi:hypothetical protein